MVQIYETLLNVEYLIFNNWLLYILSLAQCVALMPYTFRAGGWCLCVCVHGLPRTVCLIHTVYGPSTIFAKMFMFSDLGLYYFKMNLAMLLDTDTTALNFTAGKPIIQSLCNGVWKTHHLWLGKGLSTDPWWLWSHKISELFPAHAFDIFAFWARVLTSPSTIFLFP